MHQYALYFVIVAITVASPGPGVILSLSNAIRYGTRAALAGMFGISLGILAIAVISATSLGILLSSSALAFTLLKYIGAAYLVYLGIKLWRSPAISSVSSTAVRENKEGEYQTSQISHDIKRFKEGFFISVLNPKPIFFFMSLFPQFIDPEQGYLLQFGYLTLTFCGMIIAIHSIYIFAANSIKGWLLSPRGSKTVNRVGGSVFVLFGFGLATSQR